jgi:hypothetical protein
MNHPLLSSLRLPGRTGQNAVTDDDRQLLLDLRPMTDACGAFCMGVLEQNLSRDDQLALSD